MFDVWLLLRIRVNTGEVTFLRNVEKSLTNVTILRWTFSRETWVDS